MADNYSGAILGGTGTTGGNARKLTASIHPTTGAADGSFSQFGTPQLTALKIVSASVDFTTSPEASNSNLVEAVNALQTGAEVYYISQPSSSGTNHFVAFVNSNSLSRGGRGASAYGGTDDTGNTTFENLEEIIGDAIGTSGADVTITGGRLIGITWTAN